MQTKNNGGQAPYGFRWHQGELMHEPSEVSTYALLLDLFLIRQRKGTVAKLLNQQGLRTSADKPFSFSTVKRLLEKPAAKGVYRSNVREMNDDGTWSNRVIEKQIPPIISETTWDHIQAILAEQAGTQSRPPTQDLFIGKVVCGCDDPQPVMELPSKSADYRCPVCAQTISTEDVLSIVEGHFDALILPDEQVLTKTATTALIDINHDPARLLKRVNRDIDKLFDLHSQEAITDDVFKLYPVSTSWTV